MTTNVDNQCVKCAHYHSEGVDGSEHCDAYPWPGPPIPAEIFSNEFIHDVPYRTQQNDIVFEPKGEWVDVTDEELDEILGLEEDWE